MPLLSAEGPPWNDPFTPIDRARIILVANSDAAVSAFNGAKTWSQYLCEYYAAYRGIPAANILSLPLGSGATYTAGEATLRSAVLAPILAKLNEIGGQAVIAGPGTPTTIRLNHLLWIDPQYVVDSGVTRDIGLPHVLASARTIIDDCPSLGIPGEQGNNLTVYGLDVNGQTIALSDIPSYTMRLSAGAADVTWTLPEITAPASFLTVTPYATTQLGSLTSRAVAHGRLGTLSPGYDSGTIPHAETEREVRALIDRATYWSRRVDGVKARLNPVLTHIRDGLDFDQVNWVVFAWLMRQWGVNSRYYYKTGPTTSHGVNEATYCPESGSYWEGYTDTQVDAGSVQARPYYLQIGIRENGDDDVIPCVQTEAWRPGTNGGSCVGPSDGCVLDSLQIYRGAVAGIGNQTHTAATYYPHTMGLAYNLLRGMSWLEAGYYKYGLNVMCPIGDPLFAPFGAAQWYA